MNAITVLHRDACIEYEQLHCKHDSDAGSALALGVCMLLWQSSLKQLVSISHAAQSSLRKHIHTDIAAAVHSTLTSEHNRTAYQRTSVESVPHQPRLCNAPACTVVNHMTLGAKCIRFCKSTYPLSAAQKHTQSQHTPQVEARLYMFVPMC